MEPINRGRISELQMWRLCYKNQIYLQNTPLTYATVMRSNWFKGLAALAIFPIFCGSAIARALESQDTFDKPDISPYTYWQFHNHILLRHPLTVLHFLELLLGRWS